MKPTQIKNAFARIAEEAGKDEKLRQAVSDRIGAERSNVPLAELKALFLQFMAVIMLAAVACLVVGLIQTDATVVLTALDISENPEQTGLLFNQGVVLNQTIITLWLIRGIMRGFILLAVLTFILTAAAMPVRRPEEKTGGSPCTA